MYSISSEFDPPLLLSARRQSLYDVLLSISADYGLCTFFISQVLTVVFCSPLNLMVVTIDRYIAIVFPFRYEQYVTTRSTIITIASVWIFSEVYSIAVHVIYPPSMLFNVNLWCNHTVIELS